MGGARGWSSVLTGRRLLLLSLGLGGSALVYVFAFTKSEVVWAKSVDEALSDWQRLSNEKLRVRLDGALVPGSLVRLESCEHRFRLQAKGKEISVRVPRERSSEGCAGLPETFCESPGGNAGVSVEGYVEGPLERPSFVADTVMMKYYRFEGLTCPPIPLVR
ncbi:MAG TPA: cytochrome c maturation protein CcmE [Polyangiaceae bacterium]